jgi:hypothetical protein
MEEPVPSVANYPLEREQRRAQWTIQVRAVRHRPVRLPEVDRDRAQLMHRRVLHDDRYVVLNQPVHHDRQGRADAQRENQRRSQP